MNTSINTSRHGDLPRLSRAFTALFGALTLALLVVAAAALPPAGTAIQTSSCAPVPADLVSWWPGDGNAVDIRGGLDGTLYDGATFAPGIVGQAFSFDNGVVRVSNVGPLETQQLTIDAWVFPETAYDVLGGIIGAKDIGDTYLPPFISWNIFGPGVTGRFGTHMGFTDGTDAWAFSSDGFSFNAFHHVAMTWDGSVLKLYVDGQLEGTTNVGSKTVAYSGEAMAIGNHNGPGAWRPFDGLIDEVEFFSRALTAAEIQAIFNAGSAGKCQAYDFTGFFSPVDNPGPGPSFVFNVAKAGSGIPVKFSLNGNQGLDVFAPSYPASQNVACNMSTWDAIEEAATAGSSNLSYDPTTDQYVYVWKTEKAWANTCRKLVVRIDDGTDHIAYFNFK